MVKPAREQHGIGGALTRRTSAAAIDFFGTSPARQLFRAFSFFSLLFAVVSFRQYTLGDFMSDYSRRAFMARVLTGTGAAVALSALPDFAAALEHAATQVKSAERKFTFFTPNEAMQMEAVCEQIIPSDSDGPGAHEAGAIYFIDYALTQTEPHLQPIFRDGLKQLAAASGPKSFSDLTSEQQIAVLKTIESTEFFKTARNYTIIGFLGDPKHRGNQDELGWKYIGFENPGMFEPPFGYYDAELLSGKKDGK
jgi:gluconate 2-dehydrogenase gamma chain